MVPIDEVELGGVTRRTRIADTTSVPETKAIANTNVLPEIPTEEDILYRSDFFAMSRPVTEILRLFGRLPYHIKGGSMKTELKSLTFILTVLYHCVNLLILFTYRSSFMAQWSTMKDEFTYQSLIGMVLIFLQFPSLILLIVEWFVQTPVIVDNYNKIAALEVSMYVMFPAMKFSERTKRWAPIWLSLQLGFVITVTTFLSQRILLQIPWLPLLSFTSMLLISQTHVVMWCFNYIFLLTRATKLKQQMLLCLKQRKQRAENLRSCRHIWIDLWERSKACSDSIVWSIGFLIVSYGFIFVIGGYGIVSLVLSKRWQEVYAVLPYFLTSGFEVYLIAEIAYRCQHEMSDEFLKLIVRQGVDLMDYESVEEIDLLAQTILDADRAKVTLKGYITIDRQLFISFLTSTVTYLVVLLQISFNTN